MYLKKFNGYLNILNEYSESLVFMINIEFWIENGEITGGLKLHSVVAPSSLDYSETNSNLQWLIGNICKALFKSNDFFFVKQRVNKYKEM